MNRDPQFDERVNQRLRLGLRNQWYCIAASWEIGEQPVALTRLGEKLVVWRDAEGGVHVQEDYCPHRGAALSMGQVVEGDLACAYHGIRFNGDGVATVVPAIPDCHMVGQKLLRTYPSFEHYQGIFAYFGATAEDEADPPVHALPIEFTSPEWAGICHTNTWGGCHMYIWENLTDPMHGPFLHGNTFTLQYGARSDMMKVKDTPHGFEVFREGQQGVNFDWMEIINDCAGQYARVTIPYPPAAGPGGILRVICYVTPIDESSARIFFWRMRKSDGWQRDLWRFMFRTKLVQHADFVLNQDKVAVEALPPWPTRENLYQHDIGLTRLRRVMRKEAEQQLGAELAAQDHAAESRAVN